jgi:phosphoenolpyruvate carboxykinase (ATP)
MSLAHTRSIVRAALAGELDQVPVSADPIFGLSVPASVPGVPATVLRPRESWSEPAAYDAQARKLAGMFRSNFEKFAGSVDPRLKDVGPKG